MNGWFIVNMDGGDFHGWDNLGSRGDRGGHCREFKRGLNFREEVEVFQSSE